jgi:hypothetical protein
MNSISSWRCDTSYSTAWIAASSRPSDRNNAEVRPAVYYRKQGEMRVGDGAFSIRMWLSFSQTKPVQHALRQEDGPPNGA